MRNQEHIEEPSGFVPSEDCKDGWYAILDQEDASEFEITFIAHLKRDHLDEGWRDATDFKDLWVKRGASVQIQERIHEKQYPHELPPIEETEF